MQGPLPGVGLGMGVGVGGAGVGVGGTGVGVGGAGVGVGLEPLVNREYNNLFGDPLPMLDKTPVVEPLIMALNTVAGAAVGNDSR